jgi:hypothetical protein
VLVGCRRLPLLIGVCRNRGGTVSAGTAQSGPWKLKSELCQRRLNWTVADIATAAEQLGSDKAAVRLAGVYAMAGLADDWPESQQTCVDVLCAYLRMPYDTGLGKGGSIQDQLAFQSGREVRHTVIRVIAAHLQDDRPISWQGLNLDFTGVVFDGGSI